MAINRQHLHILVAEDEPDIRLLLKDVFEYLGCSVDTCQDGQEALDRLAATRYSILAIDHIMPCKTGCEVLQELRAQGNNIPVMIISSVVHKDLGILCSGIEHVRILQKPFNVSTLRAAVQDIVQTHSYSWQPRC